MHVPMIRPRKIEHDVTLPNGIVRDAEIKGMPAPREIDMLSSGGDKHSSVRVDKGPKLIRQSDTLMSGKGITHRTPLSNVCVNMSAAWSSDLT